MEQRVKLATAKPGTELDATRYRSIIESLRYLMITGPDKLMQLVLLADSWKHQPRNIGL